jgi:glycerol-3-phosphate dehydrogenase (NAD(P)+)
MIAGRMSSNSIASDNVPLNSMLSNSVSSNSIQSKDGAAVLKVAVLGAGSWGTALAALIARHGHRVVLWGRDANIVAAIEQRHENPHYLPGIVLPEALHATTDLAAALGDVDLVMVVVPSHAFTDTLRALAPLRPLRSGVAWATKGFEPGSGRFLHEVAADVLGPDVPVAVITGPSFAKEVALGLPTALTVHSDQPDFAQSVADALHGPTFRVYTGSDMRGAELGGAMKNVLAVATGAADGMNLGLNARTGLITRGLNEMLRLNAAIGGRAETLMGLAGLGDLVLTCTGELSRNRRLGLELGRGRSLEDAVREIGQVVESVQTADEVMRQAERHGVELPISSVVQRVLHGELTPTQAMQQLLAREQKAEYPA